MSICINFFSEPSAILFDFGLLGRLETTKQAEFCSFSRFCITETTETIISQKTEHNYAMMMTQNANEKEWLSYWLPGELDKFSPRQKPVASLFPTKFTLFFSANSAYNP